MDEILIECSPGISGDMILSALYDLGVPKLVIEKPLLDIGLGKLFELSFDESKSCSIRGVKRKIKILEKIKSSNWKDIKQKILKGNLEEGLEKDIVEVFKLLAIAESNVHGTVIEDVHFHELGSIDSLVDIVGVCSAINYLKPKRIYFTSPALGNGCIQTAHGKLTIPSPAVIELIKLNQIKVSSSFNSFEGELSTPTGIALISKFATDKNLPSNYTIDSYGVGLGSKEFSFPNLLRVLKINSTKFKNDNKKPRYEEISIQESLIDDQSPEEIAGFVQLLRDEGAYDVYTQSTSMKKNRIGILIKVIIPPEKENHFRDLWFQYSNTIGLRERREGRWVLARRNGYCVTSFGKIKFKETFRPYGGNSLKPESDEIIKLQKRYKKSAQYIKNIINKSMEEFKPEEDWQ